MDESLPHSLFDLKGKIACVTGASSGLGRRAADILISAGASVVGVARREDMLSSWAADNSGSAGFVVGDLAIRSSLTNIANEVSDIFGSPDILVNAAGINTREVADEVTPQGWDCLLYTSPSPRDS